jgi:hypothetical protein
MVSEDEEHRMATPAQTPESDPIDLTSEDVAFLISMLRDPSVPQPVTTQQFIEALRRRGGQ